MEPIGTETPTKKERRDHLRAVLAGLSRETIKDRSAVAAGLLFQQPEYRKAEIVMVFLSLPHEIDTAPIALRAWQDRKRVLAPKISWEQRRLLPIQIDSLTDGMATTLMGLREPAQGVPIPVSYIDLVIVPALGFDRLGNRLGRGRGFYDRFLAHREFRAVACGLAFEEQVVERLPAGPHDIPVAMLVTDTQVRRFGR